MKLSELKVYLDEVKQSQNSINEKLTHISDQLKNTADQLNNAILENKQLLTNWLLLDKQLNDLQTYLKTYDYFYTIKDYYTHFKNELDNNIISDISDRFTIYSGSGYPSLYLGNEYRLVNSLIAAEPLYIATWDPKVINHIKEQFNPVYQKKLLTYNFIRDDFYELDQLPLNQFSCIVCWDIVNVLSLKNAKQFVTKLLLLLRPGGTLFFNFNNCNKQHNLIKAENYIGPYQTEQDIKNSLPDFMIKVFEHVDYNSDLDYIKITKKGELNTIKLQPVLGEIIPKAS